MRLLEGCSTLYTFSSVRVSKIGAKLVCLSITSKQAKVAPEGCHGVVTPQVNFPQKITFDTLYTNEFVIRVRSRALAIPSECTTI